MRMDNEIHEFLLKHLQGIMNNDIASYHETTAEDLTLYEWWVAPHRLDGLPFHEFMMNSNAERGAVFGAEQTGKTRFDLSNLHIQRYSDTAIASYTLLISTSSSAGVQVAAHNESRVMVKINNAWKVAHVHKSPAYSAPHVG
ncbi:MAG: nuclear transport factor 2 family protein [Anaerolineales bacterium]|nr:nuclear transport factor 2 family protein [Chloroflexota bacterium]MBK6648193.1 nuclear transport factor 2 family protein [Anaerolineales bacterium]